MSDERARIGIEANLERERELLDERERMAKASRDRVRILALKLIGLGVTERAAGELAGVSGPAVHGWKLMYEREGRREELEHSGHRTPRERLRGMVSPESSP